MWLMSEVNVRIAHRTESDLQQLVASPVSQRVSNSNKWALKYELRDALCELNCWLLLLNIIIALVDLMSWPELSLSKLWDRSPP